MYYADILSSLRREEVILLGVLYKHTLAERLLGVKDPELNAEKKAQGELIPNVFSTAEEYQATAGAVTRTGLTIILSVWGGTAHRITPIMDKLAKTVSFEAAVLAEEAARVAAWVGWFHY